MKSDKLIPGVILVSIGVIFLLKSFGVINFHWSNLVYLWPIFLIIGGVNLIFAHNRTLWATSLKIAVVLGGVCLLLFGNFDNRRNYWPNFFHNGKWNSDFNTDDNDDDDDNKATIVKMDSNSAFKEAYHPEAKIARLNLTGAATLYKLNDTTNQQFEAIVKESAVQYELTRKSEDSVYVLNFKIKNKNHINWNNHNDKKQNTTELKLNTNPIWDINLDAAATQVDFDLTKYKVRSIKINGGAASFILKLGQPYAITTVDITTGAAEVRVSVPTDAAVAIDTDSGLSSNHFEGFNKTDDNHYQTSNYNTAAKKILIHLDGGMSDFKVSRY